MNQNESTFEVLWHSGYETFQRTEIEAESKPETSEAAQVVAVIEDRNHVDINVDAIKEVSS